MPWFYSNAGKQVGPVSEADFERLAREGVLQPTTLVWREGMPGWAPFSSVTPSFASTVISDAAPGIAPPRQVACHECGKLVSAEETMQINGAAICAACKPLYLQKMREGTAPFVPLTSGALRYAGFWIRLAAYVIDQLIQGIVSLPFSLWFSVRMQSAMQPGSFDVQTIIRDYALLSAGSILLAVLYGWLFVARYGATPGKMLVRIKVVRDDGSRLGYGLSLLRQLAEIVSTIPCMLGYLFVAFDGQKRALHDFMCNTRVVYK